MRCNIEPHQRKDKRNNKQRRAKYAEVQLAEDRLLRQASLHAMNAGQYICRLFKLCYPGNLAFNVAKRGHHGLHTPMSASSLEAAAHGGVLEMFQLHKKLYGSTGQPCAHMHECFMDSLSSIASACTGAKKGISLCNNTVYGDSFAR